VIVGFSILKLPNLSAFPAATLKWRLGIIFARELSASSQAAGLTARNSRKYPGGKSIEREFCAEGLALKKALRRSFFPLRQRDCAESLTDEARPGN